MSKQSEAKAIQGWRKKPKTCGNCAAFSSKVEQVHRGWGPPTNTWTKEYELRCTLGGFKTGKSNTCDDWAERQQSTS